MRVALITNFFPPIQTGSSHWAKDWTHWFAKSVGEVIVITAGQSNRMEVSQEDGIIVYRLPAVLRLPRIRFFMNFDQFFLMNSRANSDRLKTIIKDHKIDFLHQSNHLLDSVFMTRKASAALDLPSVLTVHSIIRHSGNPLYSFAMSAIDRSLIKRAVSRYDAVVSLEKETQKYVDFTYGSVRSELIPLCGMSKDHLDRLLIADPAKLSEGGRLRIASVGHVTENRNRQELITAIPVLLQHGHNPMLEIVGNVLTNLPVNLVKSLRVSDHVKFMGPIPREQVFSHLCDVNIEAHLCLIPGIGIASQEAMAVGLPVLAPAYEGIYGDVPLRHGENIMFARPDDQESVNRALLQLAGSPELRSTIGANARSLIRKYLTWDVIIHRYRDLLEGIC
jgi:glycosyltransferase involved in cell wall biosynthesis